jgi:hypothetical protein
MADTRCPGVTLNVASQLAGRSASPVEEHAVSPVVMTLTRTPPVEEVDPGKLIMIAYVSVPKTAVEPAAPPAEAQAKSTGVLRRQRESSKLAID